MSTTTVDEKVVEMRFDNKNFEKNIKESMTTIEKFKSVLSLTGATKGLEAVENKTNTMNFNGITNALDSITDKFSFFGVMGIRVAQRVADAFINAGLRMAKAFTTDQISAGFTKLQQKANSMSTLISQGNKKETVEAQLEKLLWFSDETSYNFTDMIDNISKFTATGKKLGPSVQAMEGIALWAAKSGQNAQKASMAMYQLSQALGAGYMRREDWKSIQNYSMDTDEFRQAALDTAVDMKKLKKVGKDTYKSLTGDKKKFKKSQFAESLTKGEWFTADVMMAVYKKYSKGAEQVKTLLDDFDKQYEDSNAQVRSLTATDVTRAYKAYSKSAEEFNSFAKGEGLNSSQTKWLEDRIKKLDKFGMSAMLAGQEYRTWQDVVDATNDAVSTKWMSIFEKLIGDIDAQKELWTTIGTKFYDWFAAPLDTFLEYLEYWEKKGGRKDLVQGIKNIGEAISNIVTPIKEAWDAIFHPDKENEEYGGDKLLRLTKGFKDFTAKLIPTKETMEKIKKTFQGLFKILQVGIKIVGGAIKIIGNVLKFLKPIGNVILTITSVLGAWIEKQIEAAKKSLVLNKALATLNKVLTGIKNAFTDFGKWLKKNIKMDKILSFFTSLRKVISSVAKVVGKFIHNIIADGGLNNLADLLNKGILGTLLYKLAGFASNLKSFGSSCAKTLEEVKGVLEEYQKNIKAKTILTIAKALGILAISLFILSKVDEEHLGSALAALTVSLIELMSALAVFGKLAKNLNIGLKTTTALIGLGIAVMFMSVALKKISEIDSEKMLSSLGVMVVALGALVGAVNLLPKKGNLGKATAMIGSALSLIILAGALKILATMKWNDIWRSLVAMGGALLALTLALKFIPKGSIFSASGLLIASISLLAIAGVLKILATMKWNDIWRSLVPMGLALLALTTALKIIPKGSIFSASGLLIASISMLVIAGVLKILSTFKWNDIWRSLVAMGGALLALTLASRYTKVSGAIGILVMANALLILSISLKIIASIPWDLILKAGVTLAGLFVILGIGSKLLKPLIGTMLKVALTMTIFSLAIVGLGAGLVMIGAGITAIATALSVSGPMLIAGLVSMLTALVEYKIKLSKLLKELIFAVCELIIECVPEIAKALFVTLTETLKVLVENVPMIVSLIAKLIIAILDSLANELPDIIVSAVKLMESFFKGFIKALNLMDMSVMMEGIKALALLTSVMLMLAALAVLAPMAIIGILAFGVLVTELSYVLGTIGDLISNSALIDSINKGGDLLLAVGTAIGKFIGGIIGGIGTAISNALPGIADNLSAFIINLQPFIEGIKKVNGQVLVGTGILSAAIILLTAADLIASIGKFLSGGNSFSSLGLELSKFMVAALPFITIASKISPAVGTGMKAIATAVLALTAANVLDGITRFITGGTSSLSQFGEQLPGLGTNLSHFVANLGEFSDEQVTTVDCAGRAILALANASDALPNEGGWVAKILGDNSLASFAENLPNIGTKLKEFVINLGEFSDEQVATADCAGRVIVALAEAADKIPNEGGLWGKIFGDNSLSKFADDMPKVATGVTGFVANLGNFKERTEQVEAASNVIKSLAELGKLDLKKAKENFPKFGEAIQSFGEKLKGFIDIFTSYTKENIQKASENITLIVDAVNNLVKTVIDTTNSKKSDLVNNFETIAKEAAKAISKDSVKKELDTQSKNFVSGFANGITKHKYLSDAAATAMVTSALDAIKVAQKSHSPSKKTLKLGGYFSVGFINGIKEYSNDVYDASYDIGLDAQSGLNKALEAFNDISEANPTIRPILDLSDIESGANNLNGMFNNVGIGANLNAISLGMKQRNQNGNNEALISAINDLNKNMGTSTGNTYNINGITYDDGSSISNAVGMLIRAANIERRI